MELARDKHVLYWLTSLVVLVLIMIIVGGLTRLTESGLSMVNWDPLMGIIPPMSKLAWIDLFNEYKLYPEFIIKNSSMTLSEFKYIFWWEWFHRFFARLIGVVFIVPFFYFLFKGKEHIYRYLVLTFIPFYQFSLFTEGGRMGQLVYLILFALLTIFLLKNYPILRFLIVTSYLFIYSVVIYHTSTVVQNRFNTQRVIYNFESSTRNTLLEETIILIKKNPIFGYGTGSFTDEFGSVNEETQKVVSNQHKTPHNNYLYVWFELGILGLIVFLSIFYFQIKELIKKADGIFLILFPIMFLIIMFTDSYLFSQNTLVLYLFLSVITINYQYKPS